MSTFILLAALASQITFSISQQANMTTIILRSRWQTLANVRLRCYLSDRGRGDKVHRGRKILFLYPLISRLI